VSHWPVESEPAVKLMTTIFGAIAERLFFVPDLFGDTSFQMLV
jgi:hypothetical protein